MKSFSDSGRNPADRERLRAEYQQTVATLFRIAERLIVLETACAPASARHLVSLIISTIIRFARLAPGNVSNGVVGNPSPCCGRVFMRPAVLTTGRGEIDGPASLHESGTARRGAIGFPQLRYPCPWCCPLLGAFFSRRWLLSPCVLFHNEKAGTPLGGAPAFHFMDVTQPAEAWFVFICDFL